MSIKIGERVQVWSDSERQCLGWGEVIRVGISAKDQEEIPLIKMEDDGRVIWGNHCFWISEKKAIEIGVNIFKKTMLDG